MSLAGCVLLGACQAAAPPAAKNAMELESVYPDMSTGLKAIKNNNKDLAAYLSDPDSVCTLFVPTNKVRQMQSEVMSRGVGHSKGL